jgi:hypothetical protein
VIIATIGASIFLANSVLALYGPQPQMLPHVFATQGLQLGPVFLDSQYLLIVAVTLALVAFNFWFFEYTLLGKKLQAASQDKEMAALLGIPVAKMIMLTFVYSALLGGVAGILVAPILFVSIQMGSTIALKAFAATIIGGFGDVKGAIIGGLALGVIETFSAAYVSVPYKDGFAFLMLVAFLIFRPQGIFGERVAERRNGGARPLAPYRRHARIRGVHQPRRGRRPARADERLHTASSSDGDLHDCRVRPERRARTMPDQSGAGRFLPASAPTRSGSAPPTCT